VGGMPDFRRYESIVDLVDDWAGQKSESVIYVVEREHAIEPWTGADLIRRSRLAAYRLHVAGVRPGDRVLTLAVNGADLAAAYVALWRLRATPVPLDHRFTPALTARIAANADSQMIITDGPESAAQPDGVVPLALNILVADGTADLPPDWAQRIDALPRPSGSDLYAILYTSGTTGQPRGVVQVHRTYIQAWAAILANPAFRAVMKFLMPKNGRIVSVMPMSHTMGFTEFLTSLIMGSQYVFPYMPSHRALLEAIRRNRPTYFGGAPRLLELLWSQLRREIARSGDLAEFDARRARAQRRPYWLRRRMFRHERDMLGGSLRSIGAGAAALPPDIQQAWESIGVPVIQGYGATEAGGIATTNAFRHPLGKVGKPSRAQKVELAADGEVLVSGPMVAAGYWRDPDATRLAWDEHGRYHTGDIARIDERGELVLIGRKKNVIVLSNGLKVYPEDIEASLHAAGLGETVVLETAPGRIEAVVLGLERDSGSTPSVAARIDTLIRQANAALTADERVDGWRIWPEEDFPRTHTMKIQRDPVREWAIREVTSGGLIAEA
jgi:long-chain acyl-CoA synthetase